MRARAGPQRAKVDLARGRTGGDGGVERVARARLRVEPDEEPRRARERNVEGRLAPQLRAEQHGLEAARAVRELAAEADDDGRLVARDAQHGGVAAAAAAAGRVDGVLGRRLEYARGVQGYVLACFLLEFDPADPAIRPPQAHSPRLSCIVFGETCIRPFFTSPRFSSVSSKSVYVSDQLMILSRGEKLHLDSIRSCILQQQATNALYSIPNDRVTPVDVLCKAQFEAVAPQLAAVGAFDVDRKIVG